jgi:HD-like signal output (HDOD) protein
MAYTAEYYRDEVYSLTKLPTVPTIAAEILRVTREDNMSVRQMIPIIEKDPPLALKILKIANSAYYGLKSPVETLRHAIVVIGMEELSHLVLSFTVLKLLFGREMGDPWLDWNRLWEHSAACGHVAQLLAKRLNLNVTGNPYSLGLLHDIGKLVLYRIDPLKYVKAVELAEKNKAASWEVEQEVFGITHADAGRWLAEKWELPKTIISAIGYHHQPDQVPEEQYKSATGLIQIADLVCNFKSIRFGTVFVKSIPREEVGWKILAEQNPALENLDFERFVMEIDDEFETIQKLVQLAKL